MSEINWSDPFMGKELAVSQTSNSMDEDLSVPQFLRNRGSYDSEQQSKNLYQTFYSKFRRSEKPKTNPKHYQSNTVTIDPIYEPKSTKIFNSSYERSQIQLPTIGQDQQFQCKCSSNIKSNCSFCKGEGVIKGDNNLIKFFEYIIAFKLNKKQSYTKKKLTNLKKDNNVNSFCSDFYNDNKDTKSNYSLKSNNIPSKQNRVKKFANSQIYNQMATSLTIHHNYICDICKIQPIVGYRYHCNICQDYDQCDRCSQNSAHFHQLQRIDKCDRALQIQNMLKLNRNSIKQNISLRPPPSINRPYKSFGMPLPKSSIS